MTKWRNIPLQQQILPISLFHGNRVFALYPKLGHVWTLFELHIPTVPYSLHIAWLRCRVFSFDRIRAVITLLLIYFLPGQDHMTFTPLCLTRKASNILKLFCLFSPRGVAGQNLPHWTDSKWMNDESIFLVSSTSRFWGQINQLCWRFIHHHWYLVIIDLERA